MRSTTPSDDPRGRQPLVLGGLDFAGITREVAKVAERPTTLAWKISFVFALSWLGILGLCIGYLFTTGVGVWGNNQPVGWGFPIVNFVFWVGIGHAGTLISAILFLFRQTWRTGINRFAEAMTIFAVICAAMFPGIHVGPALARVLAFPDPQPDDLLAAVPLAAAVGRVCGQHVRDGLGAVLVRRTGAGPGDVPRSLGPTRSSSSSTASSPWDGTVRPDTGIASSGRICILAALATPLVLSVHSVVSFDFATSQIPGWHTTIFPPYFVAGAIYGGFAMVLVLAVPARQFFGLKDIITMRHIENMCKIMLGTGIIVGYAYMTEFWTAWYSTNHFEKFTFWNRAFGPYIVGWMHHDLLQRGRPTGAVVEENADQSVGRDGRGDLRQHWDVVRAI